MTRNYQAGGVEVPLDQHRTPPSDSGGERPAFYTASETAAMLRLDGSTLYRHLRGGAFPGVKIGGRYVVPAAVIDRLVADVVATGRCVDLARWTDTWRRQQAAAVTAAAAMEIQLPGGAS